MRILFIILGILFILSTIRIGIHTSFVTDEPFCLSFVFGSFNLNILPKNKKSKKKKKKKKEKAAKTKKSDTNDIPLIKRITLEDITDLIHALSGAIHRFRRKIIINNIKFWFISSNLDPYKTTQTYNLVNNIICVLGTLTDPNLIIKKSDIKTATDYTVGRNYIDLDFKLTIRIGQIIVIGATLFFSILKIALRFLKRSIKMKKLQQVMEYGGGVNNHAR